MKKSILLVTSFFLTATMCSGQQGSTTNNSSNNKQNTAGWQPLFDGKTTQGWHSYLKTDVTDRWKVQDGVLFLDTANAGGRQGSGDLVTNEEYDNFHLKLDWKIAKNGNSGVIFYVKEDPQYQATYNTGLEMQVLDNNGHRDAKIHKHRAGDLYDLIASSKETVKPLDEWNQAEIVSKNGKLDLFLNGTKVVSTTLWDDNWKQLVAGSKFKTMPAFSTFKKGRIALQDHGNAVFFRNIMIRKL